MANNAPINLRIKFEKTGKLQYISHLDLVRTMHKIIIRTGLPIWYTEGFNPKPKMVFAAPLSIGTESYVEFMDLRMSEKINPEDAVRLINQNSTDELRVIDAYYPETKLTDLKWLAYTIKIFVKDASSKLAEKCEESLNQEHIVVTKQTKSGVADVDIKSLIQSADVTFDEGCIVVSCVISADASAFLNPEYIVKYLRKECGILTSEDLLSESYSIVRERAFRADMSEFL